MTEYDRARQVIMSAPDPPVVVNLGAYKGEDDAAFCSCARPFIHILVEPDPVNWQVIEGLPKTCSSRTVVRGAVSAETGWKTFWRSHDRRDGATGSGSICRPTGHLEHFPTISFFDTIMVPTFTLDDLADMCRIDRIDLLWVDIQGAERQMIAGGQKTLARTRYMMIEAESEEFYDGQALKPELLSLLPTWEVIEDFGFNVFLFNRMLELSPGFNVFTPKGR